MAFKSYAKGGNYGTYNVLPISAEVNEDLRIANEKVQNIQLTAQTKANHAQEYISALNNKFDVEQQNRDQNNQFFKDNHKRIYEGEQRTFEGEMAALKRRHAEEARKEAEPSTLEKALPHILSLVQIGAGMVAETNAAEQAAKVASTEEFMAQGTAAGVDMGGLYKVGSGFEQGSVEQRNFAQGWAERVNAASGGGQAELEALVQKANTALSSSPELKTIGHRYALAGADRAGAKAVGDWMNGAGHPANYGTNRDQHRQDLNQVYNKAKIAYLGTGDPVVGNKYLEGVGTAAKLDSWKRQAKYTNEQSRNTLKTFADASRQKHQESVAAGLTAASQGLGDYAGVDPTAARYDLLQKLKNNDHAGAKPGEQLFLAAQTLLDAGENHPEFSSSDMQSLLKHINDNNPQYRPGQKPTRIEELFRTRIAAKVKQEQLAVRQHNANYAARITAQSNEIDSTVAKLEATEGPDAVKRYYSELNENSAALPPDIQKKVKAGLAGTQQKPKSYSQQQGIPRTEFKNEADSQLGQIFNSSKNPGDWKNNETTLRAEVTNRAMAKVNNEYWRKQNAGLSDAQLIQNATAEAIEDMKKSGLEITQDKVTQPFKSNFGTGNEKFKPKYSVSSQSREVKDSIADGSFKDTFIPLTNDDESSMTWFNDVNKQKLQGGGTLEPADMASMMNQPFIVNGARAAGITKSEYLNIQGKALLGSEWQDLGDMVVTQQDLKDISNAAKRLYEQDSSAARSFQRSGGFYQPASYMRNTSSSNYGNVDLTTNNITSIQVEGPGGQPGVDFYFEDKRFPALANGIVKEISRQINSDGSGYGNFVVVEGIDEETGEPVDYLYSHFADGSIVVQEGQRVGVGQQLGTQGGTGSVYSQDGTIASIDVLAASPKGSTSMTPASNWRRIVDNWINRIQNGTMTIGWQ